MNNEEAFFNCYQFNIQSPFKSYYRSIRPYETNACLNIKIGFEYRFIYIPSIITSTVDTVQYSGQVISSFESKFIFPIQCIRSSNNEHVIWYSIYGLILNNITNVLTRTDSNLFRLRYVILLCITETFFNWIWHIYSGASCSICSMFIQLNWPMHKCNSIVRHEVFSVYITTDLIARTWCIQRSIHFQGISIFCVGKRETWFWLVLSICTWFNTESNQFID